MDPTWAHRPIILSSVTHRHLRATHPLPPRHRRLRFFEFKEDFLLFSDSLFSAILFFAFSEEEQTSFQHSSDCKYHQELLLL
ncbi:hypothetical protein Pfo_028945 [Paulownia fortunei]|nr:hypothetical protein Pfo_028945 [Paulownia fortunei]